MNNFIKGEECTKLTGLSRLERFKLEVRGLFPRRYEFGPTTVVWLREEVEEWILRRKSNSDKKMFKK